MLLLSLLAGRGAFGTPRLSSQQRDAGSSVCGSDVPQAYIEASATYAITQQALAYGTKQRETAAQRRTDTHACPPKFP